jgi:hypothetical protein
MGQVIGYLIVGLLVTLFVVSGITTNTGILQTPAQKAVATEMAGIRDQTATAAARPAGTPAPKG